MVGGRIHGANTISTSRETVGDNSLKKTLAVSIIVDTLEEGKYLRIRGRGSSDITVQILNGNMAMTNNIATLHLLGRGVVGSQGIGENAGDQVRDLYLDVELSVGCKILARTGEDDDRADHVIVGGDVTHGDTVAGALRHLFAVGEGLACAEVDEIGWVTEDCKYRGISVIIVAYVIEGD